MDVRLKQWTREEYEQLVAAGVLDENHRVQLVGGEIVEMPPQGPEHVTAARAAAEAVRAAFGPGYDVRLQFPLSAGPLSEPEPDVAVVSGHFRDYRHRHPRPEEVVLVVEVADTTLAFDRKSKVPVYAAARIPECWILNLREGVLEVYRDLEADPSGEATYGTVRRLERDASVQPVARPGATIAVSDLLP